jgi:cyanate lyase
VADVHGRCALPLWPAGRRQPEGFGQQRVGAQARCEIVADRQHHYLADGDWSRTLSLSMAGRLHATARIGMTVATAHPVHQRGATMTRAEVTQKILSQKRLKGLSWTTIVAEIGGGSPVYLTAALLGQMKLRREQAERAAALLGLAEEEMLLLCEVPYRGSLPGAVPTDPLIYRFYELVQVYGTTWKELIQEEFGDGIMSAIDFDMTIERQPDPKGDRVKLILSGKFLPYKEY